MLNNNLSNVYHVMSAENNENETVVKKEKSEKVLPNSNNCENRSFLMLCKGNSAKSFKCDNVNGFIDLGK